MRRITFLAVVAAAVLSLVGARSARAFSLVPPILEYTSQPGQTLDAKIKVINNEKQPLTLYVSTANFKAGGETGEPSFDFSSEPSDLATWIQPVDNKIEMEPS